MLLSGCFTSQTYDILANTVTKQSENKCDTEKFTGIIPVSYLYASAFCIYKETKKFIDKPPGKCYTIICIYLIFNPQKQNNETERWI